MTSETSRTMMNNIQETVDSLQPVFETKIIFAHKVVDCIPDSISDLHGWACEEKLYYFWMLYKSSAKAS